MKSKPYALQALIFVSSGHRLRLLGGCDMVGTRSAVLMPAHPLDVANAFLQPETPFLKPLSLIFVSKVHLSFKILLICHSHINLKKVLWSSKRQENAYSSENIGNYEGCTYS